MAPSNTPIGREFPVVPPNMYSFVKANAWAVLRLPSDQLKVVQIVPNSSIWLGKYGTFHSNLVIDRPYHLTYELLDKKEGQSHSDLRIVPASELHADTLAEEEVASGNTTDDKVILGGDGVEFELVGEDGEVVMRSNRETIDDSARQTLTMEEIEALKRDGKDAGKDLIAKLMLSHTALDQKTAFSLAKYKLLKTKKYLRHFTILPLDVSMLTEWLIEDKDPSRIMEMREELLALVGCWGNVHYVGNVEAGCGRWLVVDEVGGLLVASMAERMGILNGDEDDLQPSEESNGEPHHLTDAKPASSNTITLIHANAQPNVSLLKYFSFSPDTPSRSHPLTTHLHTISWLQLLSPISDTTYAVPPVTHSADEIASWKSGKRGTYFRKLRRYNRISHVVDETKKGGFDGLLVASLMDPIGILKACVPLLAGGAQVAVYSPTIEPLVQLADCYSTSRKTAYITSQNQAHASNPDTPQQSGTENDQIEETKIHEEDFPLNPTLLLNTSVQTSKVRKWQVLPGRTHPLMTGRGGAEGYIFTGTRVLPAEGKVEARGKYKRKKTEHVVDKRAEIDTLVTQVGEKRESRPYAREVVAAAFDQ